MVSGADNAWDIWTEGQTVIMYTVALFDKKNLFYVIDWHSFLLDDTHRQEITYIPYCGEGERRTPPIDRYTPIE